MALLWNSSLLRRPFRFLPGFPEARTPEIAMVSVWKLACFGGDHYTPASGEKVGYRARSATRQELLALGVGNRDPASRGKASGRFQPRQRFPATEEAIGRHL
jgi:hypothetical protein